MDVTTYKFQMHDGLPPDGEPGQFFGFDKDGATYVLRWSTKPGQKPCWYGVGFDMKHHSDRRPTPLAFIVEGSHADFIVRWAPAPLLWSEYDASGDVAA